MQQPLTDVFFASFDLHPDLLSGLEATGFTRCTPIQALTLPEALKGVDVAGQAQTGTGKTGAFLVATFQRLLTREALTERRTGDPRALVLAPTRELAIQIHKDAMNIGRNTGLRMALAYGGTDYDKQRAVLEKGIDVLIATPGRLIDYYKQGAVDFRGIEVLVIDEADRMFDLGFIKDIRYIMRRLPERERRQGLLYSATLSHRVRELAYEHMNSPVELKVETDNVTADRVRQIVYFPASDEKKALLLNLLKANNVERGIIFINTRHWVERVTEWLKRYGYRVGALSGDVPQKKRESLLRRFQAGEIDLVVATDVAARGLHIPAVSHVINFDLPQDAEDYVHRIGRTARLGAEGDAISFACETYAISLPDIEAYIGQSIPRGDIDPAWLVMPTPPPRESLPGQPTEEDDADADSAAHDRPPRPQREGGGRDGRGRSGAGGRSSAGGRSGGRGGRSGESGAGRGERRDGEGGRRPRRDADKPAGEQADVAVAGAGPVAEGAPPAGGDAKKKRRRRGGRNRRRDGDAAATPEPGTREGRAGAVDVSPRGRHDSRPKPAQRDHEQVHRKESGLKSLVRRIRNLFRR
ncbi:DEAD/DEAH box helicase [Pseudofulvimonas gallinarii]|uniref:ATP-dependent RNA helicase RhlB n=2 Tax=Pseudofulvimonas gallinarii TaxID=634155 RepID=A0A4V6NZC8_9GAMM|nr:DEAD/DEAH box helicase [Pseudofulvimonas gallinarii]TCS98477.1 ATP-dependent RNA helicase RhlB [Pseudofulvimonas gallinarii]THD13776.1 ATP-dependent RNA helicase RhlB [Pseudofulvimonas gallinarii]